jgi:hypothetical protein
VIALPEKGRFSANLYCESGHCGRFSASLNEIKADDGSDGGGGPKRRKKKKKTLLHIARLRLMRAAGGLAQGGDRCSRTVEDCIEQVQPIRPGSGTAERASNDARRQVSRGEGLGNKYVVNALREIAAKKCGRCRM